MSRNNYLPNSDAIQTLTFKSGSTTRLTTTRSYDASNRLDGVSNAYGSAQVQTFGVSEFDAMNRRKKITREDNTRWNYGYNDKGEVTSGIREKTAAPNTAVPGWNHGYSFDEIGNRLGTTTNGRASTYTPNNLNQITTRTVPRAFDVIGKAATTATVTVNTLATTRLDEYFYKELPAGSGAVHVPYSVAATDGTGTTTRSAGKFLPATPESSTYDFDGNLKTDGRFTYTWDAENRLIAMETLATVPIIARRKLAFAYDAVGRRIRKATWIGTSTGTWQPNFDLRFLHEPGGWNILAEITADSRFLRTYTWGTDLSGSLSGAGGVGGLLFTKILPYNSIHANGMDLNGNVTLLVSTTTGQATATYDYGPFGEPIRESGEYAKLNPYRFSTKYADDETGLLDYGLRYYGATDGRWKSRDPIEEEGGINLFVFVLNDGVGRIDFLGNKIITDQPQEYREVIKLALQKVTKSELRWDCEPLDGLNIKDYNEKDSWTLKEVKPGSGKVWTDLLKGFAASPVIALRNGKVKDNASADKGRNPRSVYISSEAKTRVPFATGKTGEDGEPIYEVGDQPFEMLLWHELVGHAILENGHPKQLWNTYSFKRLKRIRESPRWKIGDPAILIENEAGAILAPTKSRRPQYYDKKEDWNL